MVKYQALTDRATASAPIFLVPKKSIGSTYVTMEHCHQTSRTETAAWWPGRTDTEHLFCWWEEAWEWGGQASDQACCTVDLRVTAVCCLSEPGGAWSTLSPTWSHRYHPPYSWSARDREHRLPLCFKRRETMQRTENQWAQAKLFLILLRYWNWRKTQRTLKITSPTLDVRPTSWSAQWNRNNIGKQKPKPLKNNET